MKSFLFISRASCIYFVSFLYSGQALSEDDSQLGRPFLSSDNGGKLFSSGCLSLYRMFVIRAVIFCLLSKCIERTK